MPKLSNSKTLVESKDFADMCRFKPEVSFFIKLFDKLKLLTIIWYSMFVTNNYSPLLFRQGIAFS